MSQRKLCSASKMSKNKPVSKMFMLFILRKLVLPKYKQLTIKSCLHIFCISMFVDACKDLLLGLILASCNFYQAILKKYQIR